MAKAASSSPTFDAELAHLPPEARWREWMGRVEAAIFASAEPVPREKLALLVGRDCRLDDLLDAVRDELKSRPYDLVFVARGWQHRTRPGFMDAIRAASKLREPPPPELTKTEGLVLIAVAYLQPVTRARLSEILGRDISRDTIACLKRFKLIDAGPRSPQPGAPLTYVTTKQFLSLFGLGTLRDLPNIEQVEEMSLPNKAFGDLSEFLTPLAPGLDGEVIQED